MTRYVFIESRDPFESNYAQFVLETATALKRRGRQVIVFLIQNGSFAARRAAPRSHLPQLVAAGIEMLVGEFSPRERRGPTAEMIGRGPMVNIVAVVGPLISKKNPTHSH